MTLVKCVSHFPFHVKRDEVRFSMVVPVFIYEFEAGAEGSPKGGCKPGSP